MSLIVRDRRSLIDAMCADGDDGRHAAHALDYLRQHDPAVEACIASYLARLYNRADFFGCRTLAEVRQLGENLIAIAGDRR